MPSSLQPLDRCPMFRLGKSFLGVGKSSCMCQCHADHNFLRRNQSSKDPYPAEAV